MKKLLFAFAICVALSASAQERYLDEYLDVNVTEDVTYGWNWSVHFNPDAIDTLKMDIYEPEEDTNVEQRPVIIFNPAGSYLQPLLTAPYGSRKDPYIQEMCTRFAQRGWVAIAINYRYGWNPIASTQTDRARSIMQAVYRATLDNRMCVRYLRKTVSEGNIYNIDTERIAIGGDNSGAYNAISAAYLNDHAELNLFKFLDDQGNSFIDVNQLGDLDGSGGDPNQNIFLYPEYSDDFDLVLNLGGAVADTSWIDAGEPPIINFHGVQDAGTPYETDVVIVSLTGQPVVEVSGALDIAKQADRTGVNNVFLETNLNDELSQIGRSRTEGIEGIFPFPDKGFAPYAYYVCDVSGAVHCDETSLYCGYKNSLVSNECNNETVCKPYIDTIMNYFAPRAMVALKLQGYEQFLNVGIEENAPTTFIVSPNPAFDRIKIVADKPVKAYTIYDIAGKQVIRREVPANTELYIPRETLEAGMYVLEIEDTAAQKSVKKIFFQ